MSVLSLDDVVALNALIVTAVGLSFAFSGRKERSRTFLDFRKSKPAERTGAVVSSSSSGRRSYGAEALAKLEALEEGSNSRHLGLVVSTESRELNVFFNWNGHTWEAFEVLGVPAGSSRESVIAAFHASRAKSPDSTPFFQAATDAILKSR